MIPRVGIVDSGHAGHQQAGVDAAAAFMHDADGLWRCEAVPDRLGHGSAVLDIIQRLAPQARFCVAQVFAERPATSAAQVAAAIDWLLERQVQVINLSLGLHASRPALEAACRRALAAGVVLCASAPAHGAAVFPAGYAGVWRVTGDARCGRDEFSWLGTAQADFGAHVSPLPASMPAPGSSPARLAVDGIVPPSRPPRGSGASMACAHVTGHLAGAWPRLCGQVPVESWMAWLRSQARHQGPERRSG